MDEYRENHGSSLPFWGFVLVGSMFKMVRRVFFWGAIVLFTWASWLASQATMTQWHAPFNPTSHFWGSMQYWEVCMWMHVLSIAMLILWAIMAIFALVGRHAKRLLTE